MVELEAASEAVSVPADVETGALAELEDALPVTLEEVEPPQLTVPGLMPVTFLQLVVYSALGFGVILGVQHHKGGRVAYGQRNFEAVPGHSGHFGIDNSHSLATVFR